MPLLPLGPGWPPMRWIVLLFFCLFNMSNNLQWITFSTIVDATRAHFDCSAFEVNALGWLYSLVYVLIAVPCCSIYDRFGLRNGMLVGAAFNAAGAVLKWVAVYVAPQFWMLFLAQLLNSVGQCFTLGMPPMIAAAWFGASERTLATSLAAVANIMGVAVGFPVPPLMVPDASGPGLKQQFSALFGFECGLCVLTLVGIFVFVGDGPRDAPSVTARRRGDPVPLLPSLKSLLSNRMYLLVALAMGFSNGMFGGLSTVMAQVNSPFGISNNQTGWIGCIGCFASILGSVFVGRLIDRVRRYKLPLLVLNLLITVTLSAVAISFASGSYPLANAYVWYTLMQIFESCLCGVVFEFSVELTYPMPEAFSGTVMMVLPCLFNFLIVIASASLLGNDPTPSQALYCLAICVVVSMASGVACLFLREQLRRVALEADEKPAIDADGSAPVLPVKGAQYESTVDIDERRRANPKNSEDAKLLVNA